MTELILETLREAFTNYMTTLREYLPRVLAMLTIVVVGGLLAFLLGRATRILLGWVRFDTLLQRSGAADLLRRADLPPPHRLGGSVVFWVVFAGFLLSGLDALGFRGTGALLADFMQLVPRLVVAAVVLVAGILFSNFVWRAVLLAGVNARVVSPRLLAGSVRALLLILTVAMTLEHVGVARTVVLTAFAIAFGAFMLAGAITVGIAGGVLARRALESHFAKPPGGTEDSSHL